MKSIERKSFMGIRPSSLCFVLIGICFGCTSHYTDTLPSSLTDQIDYSLRFPEIKESPDRFKGKRVLLGGKILEAKRLKDSTRLVVLQLPLNEEQVPTTELIQSQGRFIAEQQEFLDPATVPPDSRITVVGELTGSLTQKLDETDYTYPTLNVIHLKVWPDSLSNDNRYAAFRPYPYFYPYPFLYPYWRPYRPFFPYYPYWYW